MSNTQTIFLNGRRYDALTGKLLKLEDDYATVDQAPVRLHGLSKATNNKTVEGFIHNSPKRKISGNDKLSTVSNNLSHQVAPHINRLTQRSKTLMRDVVRRPGFQKIKTQQHSAKSHVHQAMVKSVGATEPVRTAVSNQAKAIINSDFASRVNELTTPAHPILPDPNVIQTTANSEIHLKHLNQLSQIEMSSGLDDVFSEAALKLNDSQQVLSWTKIKFYEKLADKLKISVKLLFVLSIFIFVIIFGSVSSYIFSDNISMYVADTRTGIHGILPTFKPPGYKMQGIGYAIGNPTGTIDLNYVNNNGYNSYRIEEQLSNWDSQDLINSVVQPVTGNNYKTYQIGGRSVYIYGETAVWIDSGIYYLLTNHANLTNTQITQIVSTT